MNDTSGMMITERTRYNYNEIVSVTSECILFPLGLCFFYPQFLMTVLNEYKPRCQVLQQLADDYPDNVELRNKVDNALQRYEAAVESCQERNEKLSVVVSSLSGYDDMRNSCMAWLGTAESAAEQIDPKETSHASLKELLDTCKVS